eukprot:TRINITY_DN11730_c0_g1_i1.p1 TRINITY_DN11730_c0_g1~~TRINITY_DN11730_c0_g1_i1.p1  ORF type:complete len:349 (-),score=66.84 TRINITY_DN11730_c0_g1_i1:5-1051(-)
MKRNELSDVNRETQISFSLIPLGNSPVPPGRQGHAWAVHGQHLYVFGGRIADTRTGSKSTRTIVNDLWRFNLDGFQWELVESLGEVPSPRHNHTALAYQDKIWVFGGTGGDHIFNELLAFDLKNNTWQLLHPANTALIRGRHGHSASLATLKDSTKMVIFGGGLWEDNRRVYLKEVLLYDFKENSWEVLECAGSVPLGRSFHSANVLGDMLVIFGGWWMEEVKAKREEFYFNDVVVLELGGKVWRKVVSVGDVPGPRNRHSSLLIDGKRLFIYGGNYYDQKTRKGSFYSTAYLLDLNESTANWTKINTKGTSPALSHHHAILFNNTILMGMGEVRRKKLHETYLLNIH